MDNVKVGFAWLPHGEGLPLPARQTQGAAGYDLIAALPAEAPLTLQPGERTLVPCGFAMALPLGYEGQVRPRSGLAVKHGITVLNAPGTVDADYRGEVKVPLINLGTDVFVLRRGDRIAQLVVAPVSVIQIVVEEALEETERGGNGFGSTGNG